MSEWRILSTQSEVDDFLKLFGDFHDGCIREVHLWTETFVNPDLRMSCPAHLDSHIRVLFQRQFASPSAVEIQFDEVIEFNFRPSSENYDSIIFDARIYIDKNTYYWVEGGGSDLNAAIAGRTTWIAARKIQWRDASSFMGDKLCYGGEPGPKGEGG